jgi:hypothetical protein
VCEKEKIKSVWGFFSRVVGVVCFLYAGNGLYAHGNVDEMISEKPIVVIIPSYNNTAWCQRNLDSIVNQKYSNFHIIYLDDCSPDGTGQRVQEYIETRHLEDKITLIRNQVRRGALANIYTAVHMCDDWAIVVTVDGDDWLKHDHVLARVNKEYVSNGAWMTYGHYEVYPDNKSEPQKEMRPAIINLNAYREWDWITSHLRTFYAWLFKRIKLQDFLFEGSFFDVTWDMAFMFPMLEMAGERARPIPDILYVYNCANPINDFKTKVIRQLHCDKLIRSMPKYARLKTVPADVGVHAKPAAHTIIFSQDPIRLEKTLASLQAKLRGDAIKGFTVFYSENATSQNQYKDLSVQYGPLQFIPVTRQIFRTALLETIKKSAADYLFFVRDGEVLSDVVDLDQCIRALKKSHAHGFYCTLGMNVTKNALLNRPQALPILTLFEGDMYAWQFKDGEQDWRTPYSCSMTLYRAADIVPVFESIQFCDSVTLESACNKMCFDMTSVGLFFQAAKVQPFIQ